MKFTAGTFIVVGEEPIKLNEISVKKQKELLKKHPHLERYVVYENDKERPNNEADVQPKPKRSRGRSSKSKSE